MSSYHDKWYTRIFSDPKIVEELLRSFVHEEFIEELDFSSLKKLNTKFVPVSGNSRHADIVYEIKSDGQSAYIYLFLEFQSTVDRFMALRMNRYLLEFYQENQRLNGEKHLNPPFPVLIYNGDTKWNAPTSLRELFYKSSVPEKYIPDFSYFKIAINEIPKRELVKIRNAVSAIFYVENSTPEDIKANRKELVSLLSSVIKDEGARIVDAIFERMRKTQKIDKKVTVIKSVEDLVEVTGMWETAVKRHEKQILEKGIERGIERGIEKGIEKTQKENALKLIEKGMDNSFIHEITGLSLKEIRALRKEKKKV